MHYRGGQSRIPTHHAPDSESQGSPAARIHLAHRSGEHRQRRSILLPVSCHAMLTVLLATHNPGKVKEIRSILSDLPLEIRDLSGMPDSPEVVEDGATLEENALKKASEVYERFHLLTLADDSGLEVYSLDMKPGVRSARFAAEKATYSDNNRKLLQALCALHRDERGASIRSVAAVA